MIEKVRSADAVIWLDTVQYSHGGWSNRNRMPDGSWLTVPIDRSTNMAPFNQVQISGVARWRREHCATLRQHYGSAADEICSEISRPFGLLVGLSLACLQILLEGCNTSFHFQSHLDGGRAVVAVSDHRDELAPICDRLAVMVAELGGTTYLSGPSGRRYLNERPFHERGIAVEYYHWEGPNDCSVKILTPAGTLAGDR